MSDPIGEVYEIHVVGEETQETFTGKFRAKAKLSWSDQIQIDRMRRELLGAQGGEADIVVQNMVTYISELSVRLTETPEWWKAARGGLDVVDNDVVLEVYKGAVEVRTKWLEAQKVKGEAAKKALATKQEAK
jgi:hypothetical protein